MLTRTASTIIPAATLCALVAGGTIVAVAGPASEDVAPGVYTSITASAGSVLLAREGRVENGHLNLIGSYPIHAAPEGGYFVDFFPGHRVHMDGDAASGYGAPPSFSGSPWEPSSSDR